MRSENITSSPKRWYDDACGTAHALELLGERWSLLVVRELMFGPRRFGELRADLPGISANVLTQRLQGLEEARVLRRRRLPPPASAQVYELTAWGYESEPVLQVLGRWAVRSPDHDPTLPLSAASLMMSFRTMFDPARARGFTGRIGFRIGENQFLAEVAAGALRVERSTLERADAIVAGAATAIAGAVYGGRPLAALEAESALAITGDRARAARFLTLFVLPPKLG